MAASNAAVEPRSLTIFYGLKAIQFVICVIAAATWSYMLYELMQAHQNSLGTFYFLTATSFVSILIVTVTTFSVCFFGIRSPFVMVLISIIMMVVWIANVVALSYHLSNSEGLCGYDSAGITICQLFKILFGMSIAALTSFVIGLGMDLYRLWIATHTDASKSAKLKEQRLEATEV